jgi:hypothetical protein
MKSGAFHGLQAALFPAMELAAGMAIAQALGTLQVRFSNLRLHDRMRAAAEAGFLPVPNGRALTDLLGWEQALGGGLLFTLSVGAAVALGAVAAAALWPRGRGGRRAAFLLAGGWFLTVALANLQGFAPWPTLYLLCIPPPVFALARLPGDSKGDGLLKRLAPRALPVLLLALAWAFHYDARLFTDLRDQLLMSNPAGERVYAFYYRYTLHAAEAFKRLDQKQLRLVAWEPFGQREPDAGLVDALLAWDCLPVGAGEAVDLTLRDEGGGLAFLRGGRRLHAAPREEFLADPGRVLREVAAREDRSAALRALAFTGVLLAFPVALWVFLFALLRAAAGVFLARRAADWAAAAAALLVGLGVWAWFGMGREPPPPADMLAAALGSPRWEMRVAALKSVAERRIDIGAEKELAAWGDSPHPQERYWLARALAASRRPAAAAVLDRLLDDPNLNVRTMAIEALARQGRRGTVDRLRRRLEESTEWYEQFYAYRALKESGWRQPLSR